MPINALRPALSRPLVQHLDYATICGVLDTGYSRIPIFKRKDRLNLLGYLLVKEIAAVSPADQVRSGPVRSEAGRGSPRSMCDVCVYGR